MVHLNLQRLNVLVVDDNKHMLTVVKTLLHALGIKNVKVVADAADAFKEMSHFHADIVICDWHMAPLDGLDFVRLIRGAEDSTNRYVPIIMLTGHTEMRRVIEARDAGVTEFLAKPISAKGLYTRLVEVVERPRSFVKSKIFSGPDRRRRQAEFKGEERRDDGADIGGGDSQAAVDALFD